MAGICQLQDSIWGNEYAEAGDEAAVGRSRQLSVEAREYLCGAQGFLCEAAQRAERERAGHGSFQPFAADIANHDQRRAVLLRKHLVEIAADLLRGQVCRL